MSILLNHEKFIILSHEDHIKNVYKEVDGRSYILHQDLFAISEPFKNYEANALKKRKASVSINANLLLNDASSVPARVYTQFQEEIQVCFKARTSELAKLKPAVLPTETAISLKQEINENLPNKSNQVCDSDNERGSKKRTLDEDDISTTATSKKDPPNSIALDTVRRLQEESNGGGGNCLGCNTFPHAIIRDYRGTNFLYPPKSTFIVNDVRTLDKCKIGSYQRFDVIVMDPPWTNKAIRRKNKKQLPSGGSDGYAFLSDEEIEQLPVDGWLTPQNGVVFMWCTNSREHRNAVERCFAAWKLQQLAVWYWVKVTTTGEPVIPFSNEESTLKQPYELLIIGGREDDATKWRQYCSEMDEIVLISVPSAMHSHKPPLEDVIRMVLSTLYQENSQKYENLRFMEVFARYLLPGWLSMGFEVLKLQQMCFYQIAE